MCIPCCPFVVTHTNCCSKRRKPKAVPGQIRLTGPDDGGQHTNSNSVAGPESSDNRDNTVIEVQKPPEYRFIDSDFLSSLPPEDVAFLSSKGSQTLPDRQSTDEFVCQYFKRIHPNVPVVDEAEFWRIYQDGSGPDKISLFVFQAILFASCTVSYDFRDICIVRHLTDPQVRFIGNPP